MNLSNQNSPHHNPKLESLKQAQKKGSSGGTKKLRYDIKSFDQKQGTSAMINHANYLTSQEHNVSPFQQPPSLNSRAAG
jgi:hypothetical protein